jgi:AcrR family transcriptional regulator
MNEAMKTRVEQRDETRNRIVEAAARSFSDKGFRAASTREIASRAGVNQGLITYYFRSKAELWKAAADRIFGLLRAGFAPSGAAPTSDSRERTRESLRQFVRFAAAHPELFRLMLEEGKQSDARMRWLVDTHVRPLYAAFERLMIDNDPQLDRALLPHLYYTLAGAGSMIFALKPECRRLTGLDPGRKQAVETHAELIAHLLVP